MREKVNVLGVRFDNKTMNEAIDYSKALFQSNKKHYIYTPNPEIVMEAYYDHSYRIILNNASLVIPDGIGIVIGSKIIGQPLKERVAGYDFNRQLFDYLKNTDYTVFFYGAKKGVAELAAKKMQEEFEGLKVVGTIDGYEKDNNKIIEKINKVKPDLLLVGLGAPKQEKWIAKYSKKIDSKVFVGVGGTFDAMSGLVKRSPDIYIKLHIEWLHRLIRQPSRLPRMMRIPKFLMKMIFEGKKFKGRD